MTVEKVLCSRTQVVSPGVLNWPGPDRRVVLLRGLFRNLGGPTRAPRGATWVVTAPGWWSPLPGRSGGPSPHQRRGPDRPRLVNQVCCCPVGITGAGQWRDLHQLGTSRFRAYPISKSSRKAAQPGGQHWESL